MKLRAYDMLTRLVRTRPLFPAAIFFLVGCIMSYVLHLSAWVGAAALLPVLAAILCRKRAWIPALLILSMLPLGMMRFESAWRNTNPLPEQKTADLRGRICKTPEWDAEYERTVCVLNEIVLNGEATDAQLRLYLRGDTELLQQVELGQWIDCKAHIWQGDTPTNPGQFNFSNYLRVRGLNGYATAVIEDSVLSEPEARISDIPIRIRTAAADRVERLFPKNAALARAFILGDRSELSEDERQSYSISGAAHLLAVSGMHISVLSGFLFLILNRCFRRKFSFAVTLGILLIYGGLIGFSASFVRALLMFVVFSIAPLFGRHSDSPTSLAAAMLIYLFCRPLAILDAGFVLSYGASAGIAFLSAPLKRLTHTEEYLTRKPRTGLKGMLLHRLPHWIVGMLITTAAAQLAILPAVIHYFGAQPLWSFAVNLIAVPLAMCAFILSIIGTATGLVPVAHVSDFLFGLLTQCVQFFGDLPLASLHIARFPMWLAAICAVAILLSSDLSVLPEKLRRFLPLTILLAVFISNGCAMLTTRGFSCVFLDAGQADCAVLRTEGRVYLVDTGDNYSPAADYISAMNYDIDGIFLSHPHSDHAGGLEGILEICTPEVIYLSPNWNSPDMDEGIAALISAAEEQGSHIETIAAGDQFALSDKTLLQVLSPSAGICADSANEDSLILRAEYGMNSIIFCGDAPAKTIEGIVVDSDVLKVAHHGAADSVNAQLLNKISPSVSFIPVGYNNYGHPSDKTVDLLNRSGSLVYRADLHGAVTCRFREDGTIAVQPMFSSEDSNGLE